MPASPSGDEFGTEPAPANYCRCETGWGGPNCEFECYLACQNGSSCMLAEVGESSSAYCKCVGDFEGQFCETPKSGGDDAENADASTGSENSDTGTGSDNAPASSSSEQYELCEDGVTKCYGGGSCTKYSNEMNDVLYRCFCPDDRQGADCYVVKSISPANDESQQNASENADGSTGSDNTSTSSTTGEEYLLCDDGETKCYGGGTCVQYETRDEGVKYYCSCPEDRKGKSCELDKSGSPLNDSGSSSSSSSSNSQGADDQSQPADLPDDYLPPDINPHYDEDENQGQNGEQQEQNQDQSSSQYNNDAGSAVDPDYTYGNQDNQQHSQQPANDETTNEEDPKMSDQDYLDPNFFDPDMNEDTPQDSESTNSQPSTEEGTNNDEDSNGIESNEVQQPNNNEEPPPPPSNPNGGPESFFDGYSDGVPEDVYDEYQPPPYDGDNALTGSSSDMNATTGPSKHATNAAIAAIVLSLIVLSSFVAWCCFRSARLEKELEGKDTDSENSLDENEIV